MNSKNTEYSRIAERVLVGVVIIGFILWLAYFVSFGLSSQKIELSSDVNDWLIFSQYIGGLFGPVVAFGALFMLYFAMMYQRQELKETREVFEFQRFENTFFQLLNSFRRAAGNLKYRREVQDDKGSVLPLLLEGKDLFVYYVDGIEYLLKEKKLDIQNVYAGPFDEYRAYVDFSEYYGVLQQMVIYIHNCEQEVESSLYIDMIVSHMNDYELRGMFFYGLSGSGSEMKKCIEKYSMLKRLSSLLLDDVQPYNDYVHLYDDTAYGLEFDVDSMAAAPSKIQKL